MKVYAYTYIHVYIYMGVQLYIYICIHVYFSKINEANFSAGLSSVRLGKKQTGTFRGLVNRILIGIQGIWDLPISLPACRKRQSCFILLVLEILRDPIHQTTGNMVVWCLCAHKYEVMQDSHHQR